MDARLNIGKGKHLQQEKQSRKDETKKLFDRRRFQRVSSTILTTFWSSVCPDTGTEVTQSEKGSRRLFHEVLFEGRNQQAKIV